MCFLDSKNEHRNLPGQLLVQGIPLIPSFLSALLTILITVLNILVAFDTNDFQET